MTTFSYLLGLQFFFFLQRNQITIIVFFLIPYEVKLINCNLIEETNSIFDAVASIIFLFIVAKIKLNSPEDQWLETFPNPTVITMEGLIKFFMKSQTILRVIRLIDSFEIFVGYLSLHTLMWQIYFLNTPCWKQLCCIYKN